MGNVNKYTVFFFDVTPYPKTFSTWTGFGFSLHDEDKKEDEEDEEEEEEVKEEEKEDEGKE